MSNKFRELKESDYYSQIFNKINENFENVFSKQSFIESVSKDLIDVSLLQDFETKVTGNLTLPHTAYSRLGVDATVVPKVSDFTTELTTDQYTKISSEGNKQTLQITNTTANKGIQVLLKWNLLQAVKNLLSAEFMKNLGLSTDADIISWIVSKSTNVKLSNVLATTAGKVEVSIFNSNTKSNTVTSTSKKLVDVSISLTSLNNLLDANGCLYVLITTDNFSNTDMLLMSYANCSLDLAFSFMNTIVNSQTISPEIEKVASEWQKYKLTQDTGVAKEFPAGITSLKDLGTTPGFYYVTAQQSAGLVDKAHLPANFQSKAFYIFQPAIESDKLYQEIRLADTDVNNFSIAVRIITSDGQQVSPFKLLVTQDEAQLYKLVSDLGGARLLSDFSTIPTSFTAMNDSMYRGFLFVSAQENSAMTDNDQLPSPLRTLDLAVFNQPYGASVETLQTITALTTANKILKYSRFITSSSTSPWIKVMTSDETVDLTSDQTITGLKQFQTLPKAVESFVTVRNDIKFSEYFAEGIKSANPTNNNTVLSIGNGVGFGYDWMRQEGQRPYTISNDRKTVTINRTCRLDINFNIWLQGAGSGTNSTDYAYLFFREGSNDVMVGAHGVPIGQAMNLQLVVPFRAIRQYQEGDTFQILVKTRDGKQLLGAQVLWGSIQEIYK